MLADFLQNIKNLYCGVKDSYKGGLSFRDSTALLRQFQDQKHLLDLASKVTPIEILDDGQTIYTRNSGLVQVIKLEGKDYSGLSYAAIDSLFETRKRLFEILPDNLTFSFHYHRKNIATNSISQLDDVVHNKYATRIIDRWNKQFTGIFKTEIFLVVRINLGIGVNALSGVLNLGTSKEAIRIHKKAEDLKSEIAKFIKLLDHYHPRVLTHNKNGHSEILAFFDYLINSDANEFGLKISNDNHSSGGSLNADMSANLPNILSLSDLEFNKDSRMVTLSSNNKNKYCKIVAIKSYPDSTNSKMLEDLFKLKSQFNIIQHVAPNQREVSKSFIARKQNQIRTMTGFGFMRGRMHDLEEVGEVLEAGDIALHDHIILIYVYANDAQELQQSIVNIQGILNQNGISSVVEGQSMELAYWSMLPDYELLHSARKAKISSQNLADFITLGTSLEGLNKCAFGDSSVATFRTTQNSNYSFTFHNSASKEALGHTIVIGASNSGKTTLISFLLMNCLKFDDLKILSFDSFSGTRVPVTAFGGEYTDVKSQSSFNLNPFLLEDNHANRQFLIHFISILSNGIKDADEKALIEEVVRQNYQLNPKDRNLSIVRTICGLAKSGKDGGDNLTARIEEWLPDEANNSHSSYQNGMLFNSKKDSLSFEKRIVAFDMASVLDDVKLLIPLASYIFHSFNQCINANPAPHICFIDEMAQYLNNETFGKFILKAIREWRRRNGVFIGAVQEASVLTSTQIGRDVIKNLATYILFPDVSADPKDYIDELGLNDQEFNWIKAPSSSRHVMVKRRGGESVILDIDLLPLGDDLKLFSSRLSNVAVLNKLSARQQKDKKTGNCQNEAANISLIEKYLQEAKL